MTDRGRDVQLKALLRRLAGGEQTALVDLYENTVVQIYGLALRITASHAAAETITCEVYQSVWRDAAAFDPARDNPLQWILTITHSLAAKSLADAQASHPRF